MPRYARFHVTGGLFHIISRFHDRRFYLDLEGAREKYLELLGMAAAHHDSRIIAYCLMSSHVHLLVQLGNDPLGRLTKQIHAPFGVWINKQRKGSGAIFADRPRSVLAHAETHGMALLQYVHNNPVRAGLVKRASESRWSSHRAYLGLEACPSWLATEAVFGDNEKEVEKLRRDFARFVDEGRNEGRIPEFSGEVSNAMARRIRRMMGGDVELSYPVLGPDAFVLSAMKDQVHRHGERSRSVRKELTAEAVVRAVFKSMSLDPVLASRATKVSSVSRGRALAALLWVEKLGNAQVEMADAMNLSFGAVAMMLNRLRKTGLTRCEKQLLARILATLTKVEKRENTESSEKTKNEPMAPKVVILKRQRR